MLAGTVIGLEVWLLTVRVNVPPAPNVRLGGAAFGELGDGVALLRRPLRQRIGGLVQSKLRRLISGIEVSDADSVELVQPFNKGFERVHECPTDEDVEDTLAGGLRCQVVKTTTTEESADIKVQAGTTVQINTVVAVIGGSGAAAGSAPAPSSASAAAAPAVASATPASTAPAP